MSQTPTPALEARPVFATPQAAEEAFYSAFAARDYHAMMAVWAEIDTILCIHPGAPRLEGREEIAESWKQIFAHSPKLSFSLSDQHYTQDALLAVHQIRENVIIDGEESSSVLSTNIYQFIDGSWRMILHHATPEPEIDDLFDYDDKIVLH